LPLYFEPEFNFKLRPEPEGFKLVASTPVAPLSQFGYGATSLGGAIPRGRVRKLLPVVEEVSLREVNLNSSSGYELANNIPR